MTHSDTRSQDASSAGGAQRGERDAHEYPHADAVRQRAQRTVERVREDARHQASETVAVQKRAAAEHISGLASALRETAGQLREQRQEGLARYTDYCAEDVDRMADWLRDSDAETLVEQTQDFARRRPEVFLGGAVAVGFLLARFLKSSSHRSHHFSADDSGRDPSSVHDFSPSAGAASRRPSGHGVGSTSTIDTV